MLQADAAFSGLSVNDVAQAKQFYTQVLGLELESDAMGLQLKLPGGGKLFVYPKADHQPASFTVLNFVVRDIDQAVDELATLGVQFEHYDNMPGTQDKKGVMRGRQTSQGPDIAWFKDPAGNILSVLQEK